MKIICVEEHASGQDRGKIAHLNAEKLFTL
jgi:hypothetical protein